MIGSRAVVIGGSISGLLATRVLTDHFERVTLVERDHFPEGVENRKGVPQGHHLHALLTKGQELVSQLFPDIIPTLTKRGAVVVDLGEQRVAFLGEVIPTPWHLELDCVSGFEDLAREKEGYARWSDLKGYPRGILSEAVEDKWIVVLSHTPRVAAWYIDKRDDFFELRPIGINRKEYNKYVGITCGRNSADLPYQGSRRAYNHVGELIREARLEKGLTLKELKNLSGLDYSHIAQVETNKYRTSAYVIEALAGPLEIDRDELYVAAGLWPPSVPRSRKALEELKKGLSIQEKPNSG